MSEFYGVNGYVGSTDFDRDIMIAARMGSRAAFAEIAQPGVTAGSHRIRDEFKRAILSRYDVRTWPDRDASANYVLRLRMSLNAAYYGQPDMIAEIAKVKTVQTVSESAPAVAELVAA